MKKIILLVAILLVFSTAVFAQKGANIVAVSAGIVGGELSYERTLNDNVSVLGAVSFTTLVFMHEFTVSGKARWYPFGGAFFLDMGLGFSHGRGMYAFAEDFAQIMLYMFTFGALPEDGLTPKDTTGGLLLQPGLGWNISLGNSGRMYLPIALGANIKIAKEFDLMPVIRIGLGFSF